MLHWVGIIIRNFNKISFYSYSHFQRQFGVIVNVEDISDQECFPIVGLHKQAGEKERCEVPVVFVTDTCDTSSNVAGILTKKTGIKVTISKVHFPVRIYTF